MQADFRLGRWEDVLADVEQVDLLCVDAPYGERTHSKQRYNRKDARYATRRSTLTLRGLPYDAMTDEGVDAFVDAWAPRTRGWFLSLTCSDLYPVWRNALRRHGRYVFAPLACVQVGMNVRLAGDGPSNWTVWLCVARPAALHKWGTLPGAYVVSQDPERRQIVGGKSLGLMRALIRDYSRPGDLVCDPCAGAATTLLASLMEGRRAVGAECMPEHYELGRKRLRGGFTPPLFVEGATEPPQQLDLKEVDQ